MVTRFALLKELSTIVADDVTVLTSIGNNSGFWGQLKDRGANLFHITMGMCSPTALGHSVDDWPEMKKFGFYMKQERRRNGAKV